MSSPLGLLKLLGSGVSLPVDAVRGGLDALGRAAAPGGTVGGLTFDELLERASIGGELPPGASAPVAVDPAAGVELGSDELARLGSATDAAEAAGAERAAVLLDGRALVIDVSSRTVVGELSPGSALTGIDTVVRAPAGEGADGEAGGQTSDQAGGLTSPGGGAAGPLGLIGNHGLRDLLAG